MRRSGFTLIELLVVLVIIATLAAIAISALNPNDADRVNAAARLVQSKIMLAQSTAKSDRAIRGIRFERDVNDPRICRSLSLIGSSGYVTETLDNIRIVSGDPSTTGDDYWELSGAFSRLAQRELISVGTQVEIPAGSGNWYILNDKNFDPTNGIVTIAGHYEKSHWDDDPTQPQVGEYIVNHAWNNDPLLGPVGLLEDVQIRIELGATTIAGDSGLALPPGTAIDFDASRIPDAWRITTSYCDLLFTSAGGIDNATANVHLYVTRLQDIELTRNLFTDHPANGGTRGLPIVPANAPAVPVEAPYVVTVLKGQGTCFTGSVDQTDADSDSQADDPFTFSRKGLAQQ